MGIENTSLWAEVEKILQGGELPVHHYYTCEIKVNGRIVPILKVVSAEIERDYVSNYCDVVMLEIAVGSGTYAHDIYPFKDNLEINLFRDPLFETAVGENFDQPRQVKNYRGTLIDTGNRVIEANNDGATSRDVGDLQGIEMVRIQLVDPVIEQLRMMSAGGLFPKTSAATCLKTILGSYSRLVDVPRENAVKGVDLINGFSNEIREHINIPTSTPLMEVPDFLQNRAGGVYPTGLGFYLSDLIWHVYPLYDNTRFNTTPATLTIVNVPAARLPASERTYRKTKNQITILANGEIKYRDDSESQQLNSGNGVRFTDSRNIVEGFMETKGNRAVAKRGKNMSEFVTEQRSTGLNNVRTGRARITSNAYVELSAMARKAGAIMQVTWNYSDGELLYPGMPVRLLYLEHENVETLYGTLLGAHDLTSLEGQGITSSRHRTNTVLTLFVTKKIDWQRSALKA